MVLNSCRIGDELDSNSDCVSKPKSNSKSDLDSDLKLNLDRLRPKCDSFGAKSRHSRGYSTIREHGRVQLDHYYDFVVYSLHSMSLSLLMVCLVLSLLLFVVVSLFDSLQLRD